MKTIKRPRPWKPEDGEKFELVTIGNAAVKLYRRSRVTSKGERRFIFEVADFTAGPRRLHGFGKLEKARAAALRIAEKLTTGQNVAAAMTNAQAASFGRAAELLRPTGLSLELAASTVAKCIKILGTDRLIEAATFFKRHGADTITPRTVAQAVVELVENRKARAKSQRYIDDLQTRLNRFGKDFAVDVAAISTAEVQAWLDRLGLSSRSVKNFQGALSTLFKFCEARGYIAKGQNPIAGTERVETDDGDIEIYTPKEIAALLANAPKDFLPMVVLGAFAGLRSAEIERLEWRDIDRASGLIHVAKEKSKTRSRRLVPLLPNLAAWLSRCAGQRGLVWKGNARDLLDARAATVKAAGVEWKDNALRHSFISYRLAETQDAAKVSLEAGNSPAMVFRHYRELVKPAAANAYFAIAPKVAENIVLLNRAAIQ